LYTYIAVVYTFIINTLNMSTELVFLSISLRLYNSLRELVKSAGIYHIGLVVVVDH